MKITRHNKSKLKQKSEQQKAMEMQMSEKSMEILKVQSGIHEIEEKIQQRATAMHEQITRDLRNEITRLHQQLRERTLQAEQDRLLRSKRMEDSSTIAKENAALESQLLEINKQLDILSNKEKEPLQTSTRIEKLNEDVSALISKHNLHHSLEPEGWQEIYGITHSMRSPSRSTSNLVAGLDRRIIDIEISK
uniref:Uncharacterized protein LOC117357949 isoform X2 n=1 Tax=Geotrypetes seraphini TaxID=260995 RepID=A0A6P8Q5Y3_GEOSA|nr:uncharacterized protein LOC117357949 isoform X2 [Geotrypetes seraphini]